MHAENIEAAKREVRRLLRYTGDVLESAADRLDFLHEPNPKQARRLDTHKVK